MADLRHAAHADAPWLGAVIAEHLPGYGVRTVRRLGAGLEHTAFEINGELIVRTGGERGCGEVVREARLLRAVKDISPLPVPEPVFAAPEQGCLAYLKIAGTPLPAVPPECRSAVLAPVSAAVTGLLAALHAAPAEKFAPLAAVDDTPSHEWLADARRFYERMTLRVPVEVRRSAEAFLAADPPPGSDTLVFSHNDLGIEHVLVEPATGEVTGVIDWSDAAFADPAADFGRLYRDLGPAALDDLLRRHRCGAEDVVALRDRASFYARCLVFEDLVFGLETGATEYVDKGMTALDWLFP